MTGHEQQPLMGNPFLIVSQIQNEIVMSSPQEALTGLSNKRPSGKGLHQLLSRVGLGQLFTFVVEDVV